MFALGRHNITCVQFAPLAAIARAEHLVNFFLFERIQSCTQIVVANLNQQRRQKEIEIRSIESEILSTP